MKKKQKKTKKKNKIKKKKPINKNFKRAKKIKKKTQVKSKKVIKKRKSKKVKIIQNKINSNKAKKDSLALKLVKWQLSLKPEINFKINFSLEKFQKQYQIIKF